MENFNIEPARFSAKDADQPKERFIVRKYPFADLKPGTCFWVDDPAEFKRVRTALWAFNKRKNTKLLTRTTAEGRLCVFNPIENIAAKAEAEEIHPTQLEFAGWLASFKPGEVQRLNQLKSQQPFTQLTAWIDEMVVKSGKHLTWSIEGAELSIECDG